jgi:esterase/lipase
MRSLLNVSVCAYEYPTEPTKDKINQRILHVHEHLVNELKYQPDKIIIWGKSIGTGPSCWLASQVSPFALILVSPYLSISKVSMFGWLISSYELWDNEKEITKIECPLIMIHGDWDTVIPVSHSQTLLTKAGSVHKILDIIPNMDHNIYHEVYFIRQNFDGLFK